MNKTPHAAAENETDVIYPEQGSLSFLLLMGFPSDRIYMVYDLGEQYYFRYLGNEMGATFTGLDLSPEAQPTAETVQPGKKDHLYDKNRITECKLNRKRSISTQLNNCGSFHFKYDGKVQKYIVLEEPTEQQIEEFLSDVSAVYPAKSEREQKRSREKTEVASQGSELSQTRDAERFARYQKLGRILQILTWILAAGTMLFCSPYELWVGLCMLICIGSYLLSILKPEYFSLMTADKQESQEQYGTEMISLFRPFCVSCAVLALRTLFDVNFLSYSKLLAFTVVLTVVLTGVLFVRSKASSNRITAMLLSIFFFAFASFGLIGELNYLLDSCEPYEQSECPITAKDISRSSKGGTTYYITVDFHGEEQDLSVTKEDYEALSIGDSIPVYRYSGGLGIPFEDIY